MASQLIADISAGGPTLHTTHSSAVNQPSPRRALKLDLGLGWGNVKRQSKKIMAYHRYSSDVEP